MGVEIYLDDSFMEQLAALKSIAESIPTKIDLTQVNATETTREFARNVVGFNGCIKAYKNLLLQDIQELERFCADIRRMDQSLS